MIQDEELQAPKHPRVRLGDTHRAKGGDFSRQGADSQQLPSDHQVMHLAQLTRYDVMYASCQLTRAMFNPFKVHKGAAKQLLRYLAGTTGFSLGIQRKIQARRV